MRKPDVRNHHPLLLSRIMLTTTTTDSMSRREPRRIVADTSGSLSSAMRPRDRSASDSAVLEEVATYRILSSQDPEDFFRPSLVDIMIWAVGTNR
jgi:hypothetical protein